MSETLYVKRGRRYLKWSELDDRVRSEDAQKIARLTAEVERMQAVVDAARKQNDYRKGRLKAANGFLVADELDAALRTLDGGP